MKKIYLIGISGLVFTSAFNQSVSVPTNKKGIEKSLGGSHDFLKKNNNSYSRAADISRWVSYEDAYSAYMGTSYSLTSMANGAVVNGIDVHMLSGGVVDTAFLYGAYSLLDLGGTYYSATYLPTFDVYTDLTIDSVFSAINYQKFDNSTIDTAVIRVATPSLNQMNQVYTYTAPYHTHPYTLDTLNWLAVTYNVSSKKINNTVAEYKVPLTPAYLSNVANWVNGTDSTWIAINMDVNDVITNHGGRLAIEVNVIHGRQLTSADTVGVNANWFAPTYVNLGSTVVPDYNANDYTCGGVLYPFAYFDGSGTGVFSSHWFGNSAQSYSDNGNSIDPFQSPLVQLKIEQTLPTVSINEVNNEAKLFQNYPNPTSNKTTIKYSLENTSNVVFELLDLTGKVVISSVEGNKTLGTHTIDLNTNRLESGVYFYSIIVNGNKLTKKMTVNK
jgi:hypothetical protein